MVAYGKAEVWCGECASMQLAKVLDWAPGYTKIRSAECLTCGTSFDPQASDQGKHAGDETEITPSERDDE